MITTAQALNSTEYREYKRKFEKYNAEIFPALFLILESIWCKNPQKSTDIFNMIFAGLKIKSEKDFQEAFQLYIRFYNSVVSFIGQLEEIGDKEDLEVPIHRLWDAITAEYSDDLETRDAIVMDAANDHLVRILEDNNITFTETDDVESVEIKVRTRLKKPINDFVFILINVTGEYEEGKLDQSEIRYIFSLLMVSSALLNISRKEMMEIKMKGNVGRNSTCPCGSGKKYKHCCGQI